jgi:hypothetical protein
MPASSKAQQKFMGIVHSVQKGDTKPSDVSQSVRDAAKSISKKDAKDFADTPLKGLPNKVKQEIVKRVKEYANKMGLDHLGGDSIPSNKKRGGLRDFDGYDNVDYNRDMPMDEVSEGGLPQNFHHGRTSDYHTKLRGKRRNYDDTNFEKSNTGQPDIPEEEKDDEIVNEASFDKVIHLKLLNKAMRAMPGSQKQREIIRKLNVVRKAGGMRPLKETAIEEYASRLTLSYVLDDESILKGTPEPKDAINRESALKISRKNYSDWKKDNKNYIKEVGVFPIRNYLKGIIPKGRLDVTDRKSKERVKALVGDLVSTLNHYWKSHNIPFRVRENVAPNHNGKSAPYGSGYKKTPDLPTTRDHGQVKEESKRDYKDEYKKFQSSKKSKKYRAELNKYNRDKGTYGNGDGKDASHKGGKIVGFESASKNRGRKEKSRLKKK